MLVFVGAAIVRGDPRGVDVGAVFVSIVGVVLGVICDTVAVVGGVVVGIWHVCPVCTRVCTNPLVCARACVCA